ncbi:MAG: hypothetical protein IJD70_08540 [Clostridia bacterium]|nr:hypothetical protein [Clostridia bacterium]
MVKIHFLGTCSGTEPIAGMHHCSLVFEIGGTYYWFDAGESCAYTAHTSGMDIMKTEALFVSHPHIDHIGGMPNLFSCMNKLIKRYGMELQNGNSLEIFLPDRDILDAVIKISTLKGRMHFTLNEHQIRDGVIFEDKNLRVTAQHNCHISTTELNSFSFLIEAEGKKIVFSGDVRSPYELDPLIGAGVDVLIMETGHHKVIDVCEYAAARGVEKLYFNHHGREIIDDRPAAESLTAEFAKTYNMPIVICHDGMIAEI